MSADTGGQDCEFFNPAASRIEGSRFSVDDLAAAREVWENLRTRYAPDWRPESETVLARLFRTDAGPAVCQLIALAWTLNVAHMTMTKDSVLAFAAKVGALFAETEEAQFDERVAEFQAVEVLGPMVSPIGFEPYVDATAAGDRPAAPDLGIRLPDGDAAIEVTVLHVDQIDAWDRAVRQLVDGLRDRILQLGAFVAMDLEMPFAFDRTAAQALLQRKTLAPVLSQPAGELRVPVGGGGDAVLRWRPLAVLSGDSFDPAQVPEDQFAAIHQPTPGAVGSGYAVSYRPTGDAGAMEELVLKSLTNTLQRKRTQSRNIAEQLVLVVKSGHHRVPPEIVMHLFETRIWPNSRYSWITGLGVLVSPMTHNAGDSAPRIVTSLNDGAAAPATPSLAALLAGDKSFHLHGGQWFETREEMTAARERSQEGGESP
jgi:hypothetical protein